MHAIIQPAPSTFLGVLKRYLSPHRSRSILLTCLLLTGIGLQLLSPQLIRRFMDSATAMAPLSMLRNLALIYLAVQLLRLGLNISARYVSVDLGGSATNVLRRDLTEHILHLDTAGHELARSVLQLFGVFVDRVDDLVRHGSVVLVGGSLVLVTLSAHLQDGFHLVQRHHREVAGEEQV